MTTSFVVVVVLLVLVMVLASVLILWRSSEPGSCTCACDCDSADRLEAKVDALLKHAGIQPRHVESTLPRR